MDNTAEPPIAFDAALLREPYSGVEVMIHETACALAAHGTLPYCIYAPRNHVRPLPSNDRVRVRTVAANHPRLRRILWEQGTLPRILHRDGAQVLHAPAYVAPLATRCPVVLTVHDLHVFTHPQFCSFANRLHYRLLLPRSIRRAAAITVYSEHVRHALLALFPAAAAKTRVIPPGVPARFLQQPALDAQREAVRLRLRLPQKFLLFVGDLAPRKNLAGLLAAFDLLRSQNNGIRLVIAGAPVADRCPKVARAFRRAGMPVRGAAGPPVGHKPEPMNDPILWLGYAPEDDLPALYSMAELLLFPSFDEGFGLPALEAMASGCPVVCSTGGAAEVCGDAALVCNPASPTSIAEAAHALLANPSLRRSKIEVGLRRAAQFRWNDAVRKLETLYRSVASEP